MNCFRKLQQWLHLGSIEPCGKSDPAAYYNDPRHYNDCTADIQEDTMAFFCRITVTPDEIRIVVDDDNWLQLPGAFPGNYDLAIREFAKSLYTKEEP